MFYVYKTTVLSVAWPNWAGVAVQHSTAHAQTGTNTRAFKTGTSILSNHNRELRLICATCKIMISKHKGLEHLVVDIEHLGVVITDSLRQLHKGEPSL